MEQQWSSGAGDAKRIHSVRSTLLFEMQHGAYRLDKKLPRESALAERLRISRTQLRDSLALLEREGFITRRHGIGTVINRHVLGVAVRADMEIEFWDMIRLSGYAPSVAFLGACLEPADETVADKLGIACGSQMLRVSRLIRASGRPAIHCEDFIPASTISDTSYRPSDLEPPIFEFLRRFCASEAYMDLTEIRPAAADERLVGILGVEKGAPLLYMDEVDYDIEGRPILYSRQHYVDGIIQHTFMRKKF